MTHPLDPEILLSYAKGDLDEAMQVLVACQAWMLREVRAQVDGYTELLAQSMESGDAPEANPDSLEAVLARLDEPAPPPALPQSPPVDADFPLPPALWPYLARQRWTHPVPTRVRQLELDLSFRGSPVTLVRMAPGFTVPRHSHQGEEFNLVLQGGFEDMGRDYLPGDVSRRGPDDEHTLHVHNDGPCVVLSMREGRLIPRSWVAHLGSWFTNA